MFTFALGLLGAFVVAQTEMDARTVAMAGTVLGVTAFAVHAWQKSPTGTLYWDGQHWFWSGFDAHRPCRLALLLDFQRVVVVSIVGDGKRVTWLWLEAGLGNPAWLPLRRAIVARQAMEPSGERELADSVDQAHAS
ncbi:MAG: hypothetical protein Q7T69_19220 [Rhodoferax sp.]|nr:hypothetical protein [Rhodoferax sp.]